MEKEDLLKSTKDVFLKSFDACLSEIAEKAYQEGFNAGVAKAMKDKENCTPVINVDGLEFHDLGMEDGTRIAFLDDPTTFNEARRYNLMDEELAKIVVKRIRLVLPGYGQNYYLLPDGSRIPYVSSYPIWINSRIDSDGEVKVIKKEEGTNELEIGYHFMGKMGKVAIIKTFD